MKISIYITGIAGSLLLIIGILGTIVGFSNHKLFIIVGISLLIILLTLAIISKNRQQKKLKEIIHSYKDSNHDFLKTDQNHNTKGWNMSTSPFRTRKSGLSWGGGNIKGAGAYRGVRKSFLK